jgi:putative ABC transport system permease protein
MRPTANAWPLRAARWLLRRVLPQGPATDSLLGDLHEEYVRITPAITRDLWYLGVALRLTVETLLERHHDNPRGNAMSLLESLFDDMRFASRVLLRRPAFTAVAVATLALGIGANTAIFSVVNRTLLSPLPFASPDRLVQVWETVPSMNIDKNTPAPATLDLWRARTTSVERFGAYTVGTANITGGGEPERVAMLRASADLLRVLTLPLALGRNFTDDEDHYGAPRVVILTDRFWSRRFGRDPGVLGRAVVLNGERATIVGVLTADVPLSIKDSDMWTPLALTPSEGRQSRMLWVVARVKPAVTASGIQQELDAVMHQPGPGSLDAGIGVNVLPLVEELRGGVRPDLLLVFSVSAVVLLIGCANVATMLLARGVARQRELRMRASLGAGRVRLARMLLIESFVLGLAGGAGGFVTGAWAVGVIEALMPASLASTVTGGMDLRVLAFTAALAMLTTLVVGAAPAFAVTGRRLMTSTRSGGDEERGVLRFLRSGLVVTEMALAVVLLAAAGLLVRSFAAIVATPTGFSSQSVLTAQIPRGDENDERRTEFYRQLIDRLSSLSGVESVGLINGVPLRFTGGGSGFTIDNGRTPMVSGHHRIVSAGYFSAMGIPLVRGQLFRPAESAAGERVAVVSESFAAEAWGADVDAIGRRFRWGADGSWIRVVGVSGDIRLSRTLPVEPHVYLPFTQVQYGVYMPSDVVIKTTQDPLTIAPGVRQIVRELDANQPVASILTLDELLGRSVGRRRFTLTLMASFAGLALVLATIGIYGVVSYLVSRRTREIGIRLAIGATRGQVRRAVLSQGLGLAMLGVAIGTVLSIELTQWTRAVVPGLAAPQALPMTAAAALLVAVAAVACDIPARRAMRVDPMTALRAD